MSRLPTLNFSNEYIRFAGGLDIETPPITKKPGYAITAQNFEQAVSGGYQTVAGYERFDGHTSPSSAFYAVLAATGIDTSATLGSTVTGSISGETGVLVAVTESYLVLTKVTGVFGVEDVTILGVVVGSVTGYYVGETAKLGALYTSLSADVYRADIAAVPGAGNILGVWYYGGKVYAFRNNAGGTAAVMHESTASGWSAVALGKELSFDTGSVVIAEGATVTGAISGAFATVDRVVTESGSWTGGTAAGRLIVSAQTGDFQAENLTVGGGVVCAALANSSQISFAIPSGRFEFCNANLGGGIATQRMYGCDGKNRGFEFDGTTLVPISTGMTTDAPSHLCVHKYHLFFSYYGSIQHSSPGDPYVWSVIVGAGEIGIGDTITGFKSLPGSETAGALLVASRNELAILYGSSVDDWNLVSYKAEAGAMAYTIQSIGGVIMLDDRGITSLAASQNYGNFEDATITTLIKSWFIGKQGLATDSCVARDKNQYRLFFSDKYALYITFDNGKVVGILPVKLSHTVKCICSVEDSGGSEVIFFGSDDGFVYQMERGTSFDGADIEAFLDIAYHHFKSPHVVKRFRKMTLEATGDGYAELYASYSLDYGSSDPVQPGESLQTVGLTSWSWDSGALWDSSIYWDGVAILPIPIHITGSGCNLSVKIRSASDYFSPVKISGAQILYTPQRIKR